MGRGPGIRAVSDTSIQIDFVWQKRRYRERLRLPPTPKNLKYAYRLKATIDHEIAIGTFDYARHFRHSPRAATASGSAPLSGALRAYIQSLGQSLEPETIDEYTKDAAAFVTGVGDQGIASLTRAKIREWVNASPLSKKRLDNILVPVRGAFKQALEDGTIKTNPLEGFSIRRVGQSKEKIDPFTPEEIQALGNTELGALWTFWSWTGLRTGELIGLRWGDVDDQLVRINIGRAIRVGREKTPKTQSGIRSLHLLPAARKALAMAPKGDVGQSVWNNPNTGQHWYEDRALARAFRNACKAAGVRYRYPYQLRHTFASWALSSGENPAWIAKYIGHKNMTTLLKVYGKWMPSLDPKAGTKMTRKAKTKAA